MLYNIKYLCRPQKSIHMWGNEAKKVQLWTLKEQAQQYSVICCSSNIILCLYQWKSENHTYNSIPGILHKTVCENHTRVLIWSI